MRSNLFLLILMGSSLSICAQGIDFTSEFEKARQSAAEQHKLVLVDVYTDWCGWCKVLDKTTYRDSAVVAYVSKYFIPVKLNAEKSGEGADFAMRYGVLAYPNIYYLDADNHVLHITGGYMEAKEYLAELQSVIEKHQRNEYYSGYATGPVSMPDFYTGYFRVDDKPRVRTSKGKLDSFYQKADLKSESSFLILKTFGPAGLSYSDIKGIMPGFYKRFPVSEAADIPFRFISGWLTNKDSTKLAVYEQLDEYINALAPDEGEYKDYWLLYFHQNLLEKAGNWAQYAHVYNDYRSALTNKSPGSDNSQAWAIYEKCKDPVALEMALGWMVEVVAESDDYAYHDTYAALLFATGNLSQAEKAAIHAIELGKTQNQKTEETEKLLVQIKDGMK